MDFEVGMKTLGNLSLMRIKFVLRIDVNFSRRHG